MRSSGVRKGEQLIFDETLVRGVFHKLAIFQMISVTKHIPPQRMLVMLSKNSQSVML